ncbi:MAG TPA: hypothetical protein VFU22_29915 [Roseiflexaceae bacterium]|nr:hypothetical protein [Roseiflexaceae bacterium]
MPYRLLRFLWPAGLPLLMLALAAAALLALPAAPGQAVAGRLQAAVAAPAEAWRLGVTSEGDASYNAVIGRLVDASASFRSNRSVQDSYYIFPAPASTRTIQSAAFNIISRNGTYASTTSLTLEVRDSSGALQRSISAAPVDLQTAATGAWTTLALEASPANLTIAPGEHLVAHFAIAGAPAGTLDVRPVFEVVVQ